MVINRPIRIQPTVNDQSEVQKRTQLKGNKAETTKRNRKNRIEKIRNKIKNNERDLRYHLYEETIMIREKEMFQKKVILPNIVIAKRKVSHVM